MEQYSPIQPIVAIANNAIVTIDTQFSFMTLINEGVLDGSIDFGAGNILPLTKGTSLSLPYLGRVYGPLDVNAVGTLIRVLYVY